MQKITTFLTFDDAAGEAAAFYTSVFDNAKIVDTRHYGDAGPRPKGSVMSATFEIEGQTFIALNGGPSFKFSQGISLFVSCETQAEVDRLWAALGAGGKENGCGWLEDKFGVSWQIIPTALGKLLSDPDPGRASRAMKAMLGMKKIDVAGLKAAADKG